MVGFGVVMVGTAAAMLVSHLLWGVSTADEDEYFTQYIQPWVQFSNAGLLIDLAVGLPITVAGFVRRTPPPPI